MNEQNMSDQTVASLVRVNCILEAERRALFDALTGLLRQVTFSDGQSGRGRTVLVCGVSILDRQLEAAVRHAQLVQRDEAAAASARIARNGTLQSARERTCGEADDAIFQCTQQ